jgi:nitroimidazol reductase NimA-like FMN-containing flavoprotein (pyridoxamine 5'-phosphate oxidase superfamily)
LYYSVAGSKQGRDRRALRPSGNYEVPMSSPQLRRADRMMPDDRARQFLQRGFSGRLATIGDDGYPYCVPLLYVCMDDQVFVHTTLARGHFRSNIDREPRICFEVDEPDQVFDYGRFECDSGLAYSSVILFGRIRVVDERDDKQRFCEMLMQKYGKPDTGRPKGFFPRLDIITVYAIAVERITGKECALPAQQWPEVDFTRTPNARAPE